ncbi:MAG: hypothetical protein ABL865_07470, partial [Candidatus Nitrotoga sp.]
MRSPSTSLSYPNNTTLLSVDCRSDVSLELAREPLIKSIMNRVADKKWMIARRATPIVVILRY